MLIRLVALLAVAVGAAGIRHEHWWRGGGEQPVLSTDLQDAVGEVATVALLVLAGWVLLALGFGLLRRAPGVTGSASRAAWRMLVPHALRVLVAAMAGAHVVMPAAATEDIPALPGTGLPAIDRPLTTVPAHLTGRVGAHDRPPPVVVAPGDSLWLIARRSLGDQASDAAVAAHWPRWFERNHDAIGDDPDLLVVGTVLVPPSRQVVPS